MGPAQQAAVAWEAVAIEKCRSDPAVAEAGLCPVCMCGHPCICESEKIARAMLAHFQANPKGNLQAAKSRSWGAGDPMFELMIDLLKIARGGKPR